MCGIVGAVGDVSPDDFDRAVDTLTHRGPDGRGVDIDGAVALGHRRLSIIDLAGGAQPMRLESRGLRIVFNGEIYNHLDLRAQLAARGHTFVTHSDTETLLAAYAEWGEACVEHLRGMYAFVLHDTANLRLFGARDPFGKKPLYWTQPQDGALRFAFASEPKALLALLPVRPGVSETGVCSYLAHDYVAGTGSAFHDIHRIAPGHSFVLSLDQAASVPPRIRCFWQPSFPRRTTVPEPAAEAVSVSTVQRLLMQSVERRLIADVPIGILLSGGIDSSIIAALVVKLRGRDQVPSFSIGFDDPRFDESQYAQDVADHIGTVHRSKTFGAQECIDAVRQVVKRLDEPFADPSVLPTAMLCAFAREHVTVALGGDGGDELFAGYDTFAAFPVAARVRKLLPAPVDSVLDALAGVLGTDSRSSHMPLEFKIRRFLRGYRQRGGAMLEAWHGPFDRRGREALGIALPVQSAWQSRPAASEHDEPESSDVLRWYQTVYLPDDILVKADRASMLHSIELRSPFLDVDLAEYVNALPFALKVRSGTRKYLLRRAIQAWHAQGLTLPAHVLSRKKKGFGIPIATWLRGPLAGMLQETLIERWPTSLSFIQEQARVTLVREHLSDQRNRGKELWALLVLAWWAEEWIR
jgi:asparagine synthase (glutamine-hydrolysing)